MPLVELVGVEIGPQGTSLPVGSGRHVLFTRERPQQCVTEAEHRSRRQMLRVIGQCDEAAIGTEEPQKASKPRKEGCGTCGGDPSKGPAKIEKRIDGTVLCVVANFSESFRMLYGASGRCYKMRQNGSRVYVLEADQRAEPERFVPV